MKDFSARNGIAAGIVIDLVIVAILAALWRSGGLGAGDLFGLGQLLVELLLIPAAIVAFLFTIHEIREAKEESLLSFLFSADGTSAELESATEITLGRSANISRIPKHFQIYVINKGSKVAVWWRAKLSIPLAIYEAGAKETSPPWKPQFGDKAQWSEEKSIEYVHVSFISQGEHPSYPQYPQWFLRLVTDWDRSKEYEEEYIIPYEIFTESSGKSVGELRLQIHRQ